MSPYAVALSVYNTQNLRQLTVLELEQATCNFNEINIIGQCRFGLVYKGLLQDGSIVAIKRRRHAPTQYFFHEVHKCQIRFLSEVLSGHSFDSSISEYVAFSGCNTGEAHSSCQPRACSQAYWLLSRC